MSFIYKPGKMPGFFNAFALLKTDDLAVFVASGF